MKKTFYLLILTVLSLNVTAQNIKMNGRVLNSETNDPIEFVNIGIPNENKGTVSGLDGNFSLNVPSKFSNDSLVISHINYYTEKIAIEKMESATILLKPRSNELAEVVVSANKRKRNRKVGVKSYNPLLWLGTTSEGNDIIENAQRIKIPNKTVRIKYVNLYLREGFEADSLYIRINFYRNDDDSPGEKIVFENLVQKKEIEPGWIKIDLTENYVYVEEDFFIGVEFIPDFKNPMEVYLGAILTKGKGYQRNSSQGQWKKIQGASTINVEIEY